MSITAFSKGKTEFMRIIYAILCVFMFFSPANASEVVLTDGSEKISLSSAIIYFKDNTGIPSPPQAFNYFKQNPYDAPPADNIIFDKEPATYWLRFKVKNESSNENWVLSPARTFSGKHLIFRHFSVYEGDNVVPVAVISAKSKEQNSALADGADITLTIPPGITRTITMRIDTAKAVPLTVAPELIARKAYNAEKSGSIAFTGTVMIIGVAFIAVALSLLFMSGQISLLYFCMYIPALLIFMTAHEGALHKFGTFIPVSLHEYLFVISCFAVPFFAALTARHYLETQENMPKADPVVLLVIALIPMGLLTFFLEEQLPSVNLILYDYLPQSVFVLCAVFGLILSFTKNMPHSFWISWTVLLTGYSVMFLERKHFIPSGTDIPVSAIFVGAILLHIILLGTSLILKIKMMLQKKTDIEETQRQLSKRQIEEDNKRNALVRQYENKVKDQEKEYLQELRRQDAARKNELIAAKREAERANEAKSDFLAMISHEIRTPLTGILGMIQLTSQTQLNPQQREYVDTVQYSGETLLALLNDILDFSKIEKGKLELEIIRFNLEKLLKSVIMLMSGRAGEKGLALNLKMDEGLPSHVQGDPTRIRQILLNLINNAIKFTERGSVTIHVQKISDNGKRVELRFNVIDTGIGISPEAKARLFSAYSQADETISRKYGGTGLGLSICKKLISAMHGHIDITSAVGQGSTFWFVIPMDISEETSVSGGENSANGENITADAKPLRILCIDDNEINLKVLSGLLNNRPGRTIICETNPIKALDILKHDIFDIVLVDMKMPQMTGDEFSSAVRSLEDKEKAAIPVVAITGNSSQEDMDVCQRAGMNDFIIKPVMTEALNRTIEAVIAGKGRFDIRPMPPAPKPEDNSAKQNQEPTIVPWVEDTVNPVVRHMNEDDMPVSDTEQTFSAEQQQEQKKPDNITPLGSADRNDRI